MNIGKDLYDSFRLGRMHEAQELYPEWETLAFPVQREWSRTQRSFDAVIALTLKKVEPRHAPEVAEAVPVSGTVSTPAGAAEGADVG